MTVSGEGTLTVVAEKLDFTIEVSPQSVSVSAGDAAVYTVTVTATSIPQTGTFEVSLTNSPVPPDSTFTLPSPLTLTSSEPSATVAHLLLPGFQGIPVVSPPEWTV